MKWNKNEEYVKKKRLYQEEEEYTLLKNKGKGCTRNIRLSVRGTKAIVGHFAKASTQGVFLHTHLSDS